MSSPSADVRKLRAIVLLREVLDGTASGTRVGRIITEPRLALKYTFLVRQNLPSLDLSDLVQPHFRRGHRGLANAMEAKLRALLAQFPTLESVVLDVSEGWLGTTLCVVLQQRFPDLLVLGLQHGVMELTGPESHDAVRRLRRWSAGVQVRFLGRAVIGAGFGNSRFDAYACLGRRDERYIARLHPHCGIIRAFALLNDLVPLPPVPDDAPDAVFLAQDIRLYGVRDPDAVDRLVLGRLNALARERGWRIVVRLHPKSDAGRVQAEACDALEVQRGGRLTALLAPGRTLVVSYASTGLVEAAFLGCPIVAIRPDGLANKWYDMFAGTVTPAEFADTWTTESLTQVAPDVVD